MANSYRSHDDHLQTAAPDEAVFGIHMQSVCTGVDRHHSEIVWQQFLVLNSTLNGRV